MLGIWESRVFKDFQRTTAVSFHAKMNNLWAARQSDSGSIQKSRAPPSPKHCGFPVRNGRLGMSPVPNFPPCLTTSSAKAAWIVRTSTVPNGVTSTSDLPWLLMLLVYNQDKESVSYNDVRDVSKSKCSVSTSPTQKIKHTHTQTHIHESVEKCIQSKHREFYGVITITSLREAGVEGAAWYFDSGLKHRT